MKPEDEGYSRKQRFFQYESLILILFRFVQSFTEREKSLVMQVR
jgi:hypothetical protein